MKPFYLDRLLKVIAANPDCGLDTCCRLADIHPGTLANKRKADSQLDAIIKSALAIRKNAELSRH